MLRPADVANFETLRGAFENGHVALVEVKRRSDGAEVAALCAVGREAEEFTLTPFAVMVEGNPFELFSPPLPGGGFADSDGDPR